MPDFAGWLVVVAAWSSRAARAGARRREARPDDQILDLYVRDGDVYYRALKLERARLDRYVGSAGVRVGRQAVAGRAARVLAERLQRARAAHGHRSLSDSGACAGIPAEEHPADPGRLRAAHASRRRPHADARSDRADDSARVPRPARLLRARPRRGRRRPAAQRGVRRRRGSRRSSPRRRASASAGPSACRSIGAPARWRRCPIFSWREKEFSAAYAGRAPPRSRAAAPSSAP